MILVYNTIVVIRISTSPKDSLASNIFAIRDYLRQIQKIKPEEDITFDLSKLGWTTPLFITPLSCIISDLVKEGHSVKIIYPKASGCSAYLKAVGFSEVTRDSSVHSIKNYHTYIPIVNIDNSEGTKSIKERSKILAVLNGMLLTRLNLSNTLGQVALYALDELSSNINEHSSAKKGWFFAQYYKNKNYFDICIVDNGISIGGCFRNHGIGVKDLKAIMKALNGTSTKSVKRGFGLSTTADLLTNSSRLGSKMVVISGKAGVLITPDKNYTINCSEWKYNGTIITLRLPKNSKITSNEFYETVS